MSPTANTAFPLAATLAFGAAVGASVLLFLPSWQSMARIWWDNETYTHGLLVPLACVWLVWRDRGRLAGLAPRPTALALPLLALCAAGWLVGELAGVNALQHFAVVGMVPALFLLCFGATITRRNAFALGFLFFAVPFGEFLMPWLMDRTADFTVTALQLSGVPVLREGRQFVLPSGNWSVVEACSGLRYLLAAIPLALFQTHLNRRSARVQALFTLGVVVLALVANWVRAYGIVMIGHLSDMSLAAGVDHLVYGWLFFGLVMGLAFWIESRLPEGDRTDAAAPPVNAPRAFGSARPAALSLAAISLLACAPLGAASLQALSEPRVDLAPLGAAMEALPRELAAYRPGYRGERASASGQLALAPGVGMAVYQFVGQREGHEMISHGQGALPSESGPPRPSLVTQRAERAAALPGAPGGATVSEQLIEHLGRRWLVWEWFWVDGQTLADPRAVKLATAASLLAGRGDESLAFVAWTPLGASESTGAPAQAAADEARTRLRAATLRLAEAGRPAGL
ncbi:MAG: exosortase A [Betaproteobacteria bacterium]|nr:exosortase A [Betaproteobacteria bacterium]